MKDLTAVEAVFNRDISAWVAVKNRFHGSFMATKRGWICNPPECFV